MIRMTRINEIKCDNEAIKPERVKTEKYLRKTKMKVGLSQVGKEK